MTAGPRGSKSVETSPMRASTSYWIGRKPVTKSANSARGWGAVRYGKGGYGVGEESIEVQLNDGTSFQCLDLVKNVLATWQSFSKSHGMGAPRVEVPQAA